MKVKYKEDKNGKQSMLLVASMMAILGEEFDPTKPPVFIDDSGRKY